MPSLKYFSRIALFATGFCIVSACRETPPESRFDKLASAYCECAGQLVALNKQAEAQKADTSASIDFQALQSEYAKTKDCSALLVTRFGKLKTADLPEMERTLAGKCPDLANHRDLLREMLGE